MHYSSDHYDSDDYEYDEDRSSCDDEYEVLKPKDLAKNNDPENLLGAEDHDRNFESMKNETSSWDDVPIPWNSDAEIHAEEETPQEHDSDVKQMMKNDSDETPFKNVEANRKKKDGGGMDPRAFALYPTEEQMKELHAADVKKAKERGWKCAKCSTTTPPFWKADDGKRYCDYCEPEKEPQQKAKAEMFDGTQEPGDIQCFKEDPSDATLKAKFNDNLPNAKFDDQQNGSKVFPSGFYPQVFQNRAYARKLQPSKDIQNDSIFVKAKPKSTSPKTCCKKCAVTVTPLLSRLNENEELLCDQCSPKKAAGIKAEPHPRHFSGFDTQVFDKEDDYSFDRLFLNRPTPNAFLPEAVMTSDDVDKWDVDYSRPFHFDDNEVVFSVPQDCKVEKLHGERLDSKDDKRHQSYNNPARNGSLSVNAMTCAEDGNQEQIPAAILDSNIDDRDVLPSKLPPSFGKSNFKHPKPAMSSGKVFGSQPPFPPQQFECLRRGFAEDYIPSNPLLSADKLDHKTSGQYDRAKPTTLQDDFDKLSFENALLRKALENAKIIEKSLIANYRALEHRENNFNVQQEGDQKTMGAENAKLQKALEDSEIERKELAEKNDYLKSCLESSQRYFKIQKDDNQKAMNAKIASLQIDRNDQNLEIDALKAKFDKLKKKKYENDEIMKKVTKERYSKMNEEFGKLFQKLKKMNQKLGKPDDGKTETSMTQAAIFEDLIENFGKINEEMDYLNQHLISISNLENRLTAVEERAADDAEYFEEIQDELEDAKQQLEINKKELEAALQKIEKYDKFWADQTEALKNMELVYSLQEQLSEAKEKAKSAMEVLRNCEMLDSVSLVVMKPLKKEEEEDDADGTSIVL